MVNFVTSKCGIKCPIWCTAAELAAKHIELIIPIKNPLISSRLLI